MDPITQATVAAVAAQSKGSVDTLKQAATVGALAGMAPDLDVLIRSSHDPMLALDFHRHFTHSLFFIPFGAAICAVFFYCVLNRWWQLPFAKIYLWSLLGYASHGLLDACTTYGTQLLWPFSDLRVAWNNIFVVDPAFTLPVLACVIFAFIRRSRHWWGVGLLWASCYLALGWLQHERAEAIGYELAEQRGHKPTQLEAKPSFANLMIWKILYECDGRYYVDAVKAGFGQNRIWEGSSIQKLDVARDFPWLDKESQQARDLQRFTHFSSGYTGIDPDDSSSIVDIRYSLIPHRMESLWGIRLSPEKDQDGHAEYWTQSGDALGAIGELIDMIQQ